MSMELRHKLTAGLASAPTHLNTLSTDFGDGLFGQYTMVFKEPLNFDELSPESDRYFAACAKGDQITIVTE